MTSQNRFAAFVKAVGVWAFVTGLGTLPQAIYYLRQFSDPEDFFYMIMETVAEPLLMGSIGFWLMRSNWVVQKAYSQSGTIENHIAADFDHVQALELFSAILKTFGVWLILSGLTRIPSGIEYCHRVRSMANNSHGLNALFQFESIAVPALPIAQGCLLLISTNWFIKLGFHNLFTTDADDTPEPIQPQAPQALLFEVLVKAIGVWFIVLGINKLPHAISIAGGGVSSSKVFFQLVVVIFGLPIMSIVVGGLCFFATDLFSKFAFPASAENLADV